MDVYILSRRNLRYKNMKEGRRIVVHTPIWILVLGMNGWEYYRKCTKSSRVLAQNIHYHDGQNCTLVFSIRICDFHLNLHRGE